MELEVGKNALGYDLEELVLAYKRKRSGFMSKVDFREELQVLGFEDEREGWLAHCQNEGVFERVTEELRGVGV